MHKILIIEDDKTLREELGILLDKAGYETEALFEFSDLAEQMKNSLSDLILLDIGLPYENGESALQAFRKESDTPVIMLTSRAGDMDEVVSMSYGADDYITKPYNPAILLLRISSVLKRSGRQTVQTYRGIQVSGVKGTLTLNGKEQILTKNEMIIFQVLLDRQGEIVSRDELMTALWDNAEYVNDNALSVNVSRLRAKLADFGIKDAIDTRKKQGYVLK